MRNQEPGTGRVLVVARNGGAALTQIVGGFLVSAILLQTVGRLLPNVMRLSVAHRLRIVQDADRMAVLQDRKIVQSGGFTELVGRPGLFREMWQAQSRDDGGNEESETELPGCARPESHGQRIPGPFSGERATGDLDGPGRLSIGAPGVVHAPRWRRRRLARRANL